MLKNDFPTFLDSYKNAPAGIKRAIDDSTIPDFVADLAQKYPAVETVHKDLINLIADTVLGLVGLRIALDSMRTDPEFEKHYSDEFAEEISKFVSKIQSQETELDSGLKPVKSTWDNEATTKVVTKLEKQTPKQERDVTQTNPSTVPPLRTMQSDVERIHGYGAYRKKFPDADEASTPSSKLRPLADLPRYEKGD